MKSVLPANAAFFMFIFLSACGAGSSQGVNANENQPVSFVAVAGGGEVRTGVPNNSLSTPTVFVLHSELDSTNLWNFMGMSASLPSINFNNAQFIAVVDRVQSSSGHSIAVTGVKSSSNGIIVEAVESSPGQGCSPQTISAQPFAIVRTPITTGTTELNLTQNTTICN